MMKRLSVSFFGLTLDVRLSLGRPDGQQAAILHAQHYLREGVLWLITLVIWWRSRPGSPEPHQQQSRPSGQAAAAGAARSRFQAACCANDARQARRELLDWAAAHWPDAPPAGLDELARRLDDLRLAQDLRELDRILYRGDTQSWDGKELAQRLGKLPKQKPPTGGRSPLPDLYA